MAGSSYYRATAETLVCNLQRIASHRGTGYCMKIILLSYFEVTMTNIHHWQHHASVDAALRQLADYGPVLDTAITVQQIAAPTFAEQRRGDFVLEYMQTLQLHDLQRDAVGNVYGRHPGYTNGPALLVTAHMDTVFPEDTDLTLRWVGEQLYGPGIGDNSLGVAALLHLARVIHEYDLPHAHDIWFVADVGEEGLGDLCGMRAVIERLRSQIGAVIVLEGCDFGKLHHQAIGVRRYRIDVTAPGGHAWGDFGNVSAVHVLVRIASRLTELSVAIEPRSTFNLGVIRGGTAINAIAEHASLLLDLRSVDTTTLQALITQVETIVADQAALYPEAQVTLTLVGDRPAGAIAREHPLIRAATAAYTAVGATVSYVQSSTDANIPLSQHIPAVCIGLANGQNAHRSDEYIVPTNLGRGMQALLLLAMAASDQVIADC